MKTTRILLVLMLFAVIHSNVKAQFSQIWSNNSILADYPIGAQNMDSDPAKEIAFFHTEGLNVTIIDGSTGTLYWDSRSEFNNVFEASIQLIDVDGNGIYEILFFGEKNISGNYDWFLYGSNGLTNVKNNESSIQSLNYPNPFSQTTRIKYYVTEDNSRVTVKIFDNRGNELETPVNEIKSIGNYEIQFNGIDLSNGVYYYQVNIGNKTGTKEMIKIE